MFELLKSFYSFFVFRRWIEKRFSRPFNTNTHEIRKHLRWGEICRQ